MHASSDLFRQMVLAAHGGERTVEAVFHDVAFVVSHANASLQKIATSFSCSVPQLDTTQHRVVSISHKEARTRLKEARTRLSAA